MEYAKDGIFKLNYNTSFKRIKIKEQKWTSKLFDFCKKYKLISIFLTAFIILSSINFMLIYNFIKILANI